MKIRQLVETTYGNDINLISKRLVELPNNLPQTVTGKFWCNRNKLTSLEYCPSYVGGNFWCYDNKLTSLKYCPSQVGGSFRCQSNQLTSLEHCPSQVGSSFYCNDNQLTSLKDIHKRITKIGGDFVCRNNPIRSHILGLMMIEIGGIIKTELGNGTDVDEVLNTWKNQGRKGVLGAQRELLELGYEELAQL